MFKLENIYVQSGLIQDADLFANLIPAKNILLVTDPTVAKLHLQTFLPSLNAYNVVILRLEVNEQQKNWAAVETILTSLTQQQQDRSTTIVSFGGGVIGDLTGFAASLYMRGINWLQIPTTLMAQVDAAIGGKTGCNFLGHKNLIGTFYQPHAIVVDLDLLTTLPDREFIAGLAEVVKYGFVCDAEFFCWLESNVLQIMRREASALKYMVARCCTIKHAIVTADQREQKQRMILNFGHSFGHALEAATQYKSYLHGEAVAFGMLLASRLAVKIGLLDQVFLTRLVSLLTSFRLNLKFPNVLGEVDMLRDFMSHDKKKRAGVLNLVLPCGLGTAVIMSELQITELKEVLQSV